VEKSPSIGSGYSDERESLSGREKREIRLEMETSILGSFQIYLFPDKDVSFQDPYLPHTRSGFYVLYVHRLGLTCSTFFVKKIK
jgi:hypothetical protein